MAFYESILGRVQDETAKKLLTDWYALYYSRLTDSPGTDEVYQFNYQFMTHISAQANNRLASLINARGPNLQMNAACSSTSCAITIAEDMIRSGRVKRMIVIGADDPTSKTNFPWLGAGFLCTGAATNEGDLYKAAIPFDLRRNGMIVSARAVGLVLETKGEAERRGVVEICQLLGSHAFNTAQDPTQIDADQFSEEMDRFLTRMEREHGLLRDALARQSLYIAHETYTPPRGGCSQTEAIALQRAFGDRYTDILVGNTKGMTGHTMGAALEDAVAAKALQYGRVPPVVNYAVPDPLLAGLNLSKGGTHDRTYVLKMSAGFGSQGNLILLRKACSGDNRIADSAKYAQWLKSVAGDPQATLNHLGRVLVIKDNQTVVLGDKRAGTTQPVAKSMETPSSTWAEVVVAVPPTAQQHTSAAEILQVMSEMTGYPPEMLESDMELEADLVQDQITSLGTDRCGS